MIKTEKYIVGKTLISSQKIRDRVKVIARKINKDYSDKNLLIIVLLKGSFIFAADLLRSIKIDSTIDFVKMGSYGSSMRQKKLVWHFKMTDEIKGRDVLIIDDIYDSGKTLYNTVKYIKAFGPASVKACVLLKKKRKRKGGGKIALNYKGFEVPDVFVVGYGLDFAGKYRNLPYIAKIVKK